MVTVVSTTCESCVRWTGRPSSTSSAVTVSLTAHLLWLLPSSCSSLTSASGGEVSLPRLRLRPPPSALRPCVRMVGFACSDFAARKRRVLDDLQHNTNDLSPKGSVDAPISSLVSLINSTADFYTTSTCSGRLSIFQHDDPQHPKTGRWLLVEHQQVTAEQVREAIRRGLSSQCEEKEELKEVEGGKASSHAVLKFEPFIVSVACRSLASASALLAVAVQSGCRESGIAGLHLPTAKHGDGQRDAGQLPSSLPQPVLLSVRSSIRLEVPVLHEGRLLVSDAFVDHCVQQANDKFTRNWTVCAQHPQLSTPASSLPPFRSSPPPCSLPSCGSGWECSRLSSGAPSSPLRTKCRPLAPVPLLSVSTTALV